MQSSSSEFLQRLSGAIEDVVQNTSESVVTVGLDGRTGTGVAVDGGRILTANHVVHRLDEVELAFGDDKRFPAKVIGRNPYADLALLEAESSGLKPIEFGNSSKLAVGQFVLALARPFPGPAGVTSGVITGVNRAVGGWWRFSVKDAIVTDARLNPGYSGGPLVDAGGRMVGMNIAYVMNRGIAVPSETVKRSLEKMAKGESVKRAYLGIVAGPIELPDELASRKDVNQESALMVYSVEQGSAAKSAGLSLGDVLLKLGEHRLTSMQDLEGALSEEAIGQETKLLVLKGEQLKEMSVTPGTSN